MGKLSFALHTHARTHARTHAHTHTHTHTHTHIHTQYLPLIWRLFSESTLLDATIYVHDNIGDVCQSDENCRVLLYADRKSIYGVELDHSPCREGWPMGYSSNTGNVDVIVGDVHSSIILD